MPTIQECITSLEMTSLQQGREYLRNLNLSGLDSWRTYWLVNAPGCRDFTLALYEEAKAALTGVRIPPTETIVPAGEEVPIEVLPSGEIRPPTPPPTATIGYIDFKVRFAIVPIVSVFDRLFSWLGTLKYQGVEYTAIQQVSDDTIRLHFIERGSILVTIAIIAFLAVLGVYIWKYFIFRSNKLEAEAEVNKQNIALELAKLGFTPEQIIAILAGTDVQLGKTNGNGLFSSKGINLNSMMILGLLAILLMKK